MIDYGFVKPFCYLQAAIGPEGQVIVYREIYRAGLNDLEQAAVVRRQRGEILAGYYEKGVERGLC